MSVERTDRRPLSCTHSQPVTLTRLGASAQPPFEAVTSAAVVAVTQDDMLVVADLARGLDIPGGHVQRHEKSIEETVRREAWEEARITLANLKPVEVIESDYFGADDLTYLVIFAARVMRLAPWEEKHESAGRMVLAPFEFLERYRAGDPELMQYLVNSALVVLGVLPGGRPGTAS